MFEYRKHSTKRIKMKSSNCRFLRGINAQYFLRSHYYFVCDTKSLFALSVIFCVLQHAVPCCCSVSANSPKSTNVRTLNTKVGSENENGNHIHKMASSTRQEGRGEMTENNYHHHQDIDIVGYGEDCSVEGPFCDEALHLTCDSIDETCICNEKQGYIHINDISGGMEEQLLIQNDEAGNPYVDLSGIVCISKHEIIKRAEQLLGIYNMEDQVVSGKEGSSVYEFIDDAEEDYEEYDLHNYNMAMHEEPKEKASVYNKFLEIKNTLFQPKEDYEDKRLQRFQLGGKTANSGMSEKELIIEEILKYRRGSVGLDEFKPLLKELLDSQFMWRTNRFSNSICSHVFDVDLDGIFTHEEYAIALFSENIRSLVIPKVFINLIGPLVEESCLSLEDLRALDHSSEDLPVSYHLMDTNGDSCISPEEFSKYASETCCVNWMTVFLRETKIQGFLDILDPTPEEMYVRRGMQNDRLIMYWDHVDQNKDGFISFEELHYDLTSFQQPSETSHIETSDLMTKLDKNNDELISMNEVKQQIYIPELNEKYQLTWLESLYELYETDEDQAEINDYLDILHEGYKKVKAHISREENLEKGTYFKESITERVFAIFDRNSNGEIDEVEFKLLMEMMKKYVLFELLNDTIDAMDRNSDRKLSIFEYQEYFMSSPASIYFRNLLALEERIQALESGEENEVESEDAFDMEEEEEDFTDGDEEDSKEPTVSSTKLTKRAAASNESEMVYKLFLRLDVNLDGFVTKEDFYNYASSFKSKKSTVELKEEFSQLDVDKDGILTSKDSEDFVVPIDFDKFKETSDAFSEEVFVSDLKIQFPLADINNDGIIQKEEFLNYNALLFPPDEDKEFLNWAEDYLSKIPTITDEDSWKAFAEFDANCDRFISETEFQAKLDTFREKTKDLQGIARLEKNTFLYFNSLDLNKDGKISHNEFQLLLLRTGEKLLWTLLSNGIVVPFE